MLVSVADKAKAWFAESVEPFGLPPHLARAILFLDTPAPMRGLAEQLRCDRSYITGLADELEDRGLITRVPGEDRRVKLLALTPAGIELRDRVAEAVGENALVMQRLDEAERARLERLLVRLVDASD